ncbi:hypothetical protein F5Y03DRAFT_396079 [Xylaria venustula]|nr:hypothetical protein F5Y03DRAFT_396079 [Xylaria venustula]
MSGRPRHGEDGRYHSSSSHRPVEDHYPPFRRGSFSYSATTAEIPPFGWSRPPQARYNSYGVEEDIYHSYGPPRRRYSARAEEASDEDSFYYSPGRDSGPRYEYIRERSRTTTFYYGPRSHEYDREPHTPSRRVYDSGSREHQSKPLTSSSKPHDSQSHKKNHKSHKPSVKSRDSRSHEKHGKSRNSSENPQASSLREERKTQKPSRAYASHKVPSKSQKNREESDTSSFANFPSEMEGTILPRDYRRQDSDTDSAEGSARYRTLPSSIRRALVSGKEAIKFLRLTITIVLMYEWCYTGYEAHTIPDKQFRSTFKVIPVERDTYGQFRPIEDREGKWGIKTEYDLKYDTYLETILIRVPRELSGVTHSQLKAAYRRFAVEPRIKRLKDLYEIPFKDDPRFRKYAILFKFETGSETPRLFDDYLLEHAVIKIRHE